ncbi:MAG TPA: hypothetical protein VFN18_09930 [Solirubrobacterales bacterium]|nr:hypothetical protein [Solirubrobacterales bacterium]
MKLSKIFGFAAVMAMAVMAIGAGSASATTLEVNGVAQNNAVTINASLESGSSALLKDSGGTTVDTCTESSVGGTTEKDVSGDYSGTTVTGALTTLSFGKCSHPTKVISKGKLHVEWITGTTNGTVSSSGAEVTVWSTVFQITAVCKTGEGSDIGTLTGATNGSSNSAAFATLDINGKMSCGIFSATWTGSYIVTSPAELGVVS